MGLSRTALADQLALSKQAISRYERNEDNPTYPVLEEIAKILHQDAEFFLRPLRTIDRQENVFYRRLKKVKKAELKKVAIWKEWYEELIELLSRYLELPALNLPPHLFVPHDPMQIDMAEIEQAALLLREHWNLGQRPIGNLVRQMERNGLLVARFNFDVAGVDGFSLRCASAPISLIALNTVKSNAFRSRFDAAHELGHHILHQSVTWEMMQDPAIHEEVERQAHRFASAFLMPMDSFRDDLFTYKLETLVAVKERWNVSISAILYRMKDMGLINDDEHKEMRKAMSGRRWITEEPLDAESVPEKPALLAQAVETLVDQAGFSKQDVLDDLNLRPTIIEQLAGLPFGYFEQPERHSLPVTNLRIQGA